MRLSLARGCGPGGKLPTLDYTLLEFLEQCDLSGMVELVLHDSTEQVIEVLVGLFFPGHLLLQTGFRKRCHGLNQFMVFLFDGLDITTPCGIASVLNWRKVLGITELHGVALGSADRRAIPGGNMQQQLPDTMRVRNRL